MRAQLSLHLFLPIMFVASSAAQVGCDDRAIEDAAPAPDSGLSLQRGALEHPAESSTEVSEAEMQEALRSIETTEELVAYLRSVGVDPAAIGVAVGRDPTEVLPDLPAARDEVPEDVYRCNQPEREDTRSTPVPEAAELERPDPATFDPRRDIFADPTFLTPRPGEGPVGEELAQHEAILGALCDDARARASGDESARDYLRHCTDR